MWKCQSFKKVKSFESQESILEKETITGIFKELLAPLNLYINYRYISQDCNGRKYLLILYRNHYELAHLQSTNIDQEPDFFSLR